MSIDASHNFADNYWLLMIIWYEKSWDPRLLVEGPSITPLWRSQHSQLSANQKPLVFVFVFDDLVCVMVILVGLGNRWSSLTPTPSSPSLTFLILHSPQRESCWHLSHPIPRVATVVLIFDNNWCNIDHKLKNINHLSKPFLFSTPLWHLSHLTFPSSSTISNQSAGYALPALA